MISPMARWTGLAAPSMAAAVLLAGCAGQAPAPTPVGLPTAATTAPTTTTSTAKPYDYRNLLLQPQDMVLPNAGYSVPRPATLNPSGIPGAEVMLTSNDGTNAVGTTIVLLDEASAAPVELPKAIANLKTVSSSVPPVPVPVGDAGVAVSGVTPDGTKSATALVFRQDRAIVRIDFYTTLGAVTPLDTVIDIGQKQTVALRAGLPALD
ncbi:hypothetical protein H7J06_18430 [Mycobacterium hodleri]|uniref:hypothetical protein n=1 Tax=Mycolicibacterium hodleri TaxID=49897 RepID=UPI0021F35B81|nr:hypothetical protein [Mycolicibacterium hodleri]MCV7134960.1 hypothetical protein [Mycolicibacterium hodleri]